ncbi:hypothetical protein L2E82_08734 [Cichorium intybus]|uniref:Uncharacterized protein n=1 Tax=Cichorium intybus TaxID=13427 RepID=A0ACB9G6W8_CICIN|nr:hypothetical protein L2E82_08734 [Cichorium intybus]
MESEHRLIILRYPLCRQEPRCIKYVVDTVSNTLFPNKDLVVLQGVDHLKISLQKLKSATNNFSKDYFITKGGFGEVYKARYEDGIVAIKKLDKMQGQGHPQFMMEIALLSAYKHENLVSLLVDVSKHPRVPFSAELAQTHYKNGALDEIIDSDLRKQMNPASLSTFSTVANQCLKSLGQERPRMSMVVKEIEKALGQQVH